ncbi:MAG: hypothetical protein IT373_06780 [Polyangiaceae bacterium]|nr:hypothetical protein [Polyangiaceae bacterium]
MARTGGAWLLGLGALLGAAAVACGYAVGADPVKNKAGAGGSGATTFSTATGGGGAGPTGGAGGATTGSGGDGGAGGTVVPVPDPFAPTAMGTGEWTGTLPPGGLFDPEATVYFPGTVLPGEKFPIVLFAHELDLGDTDYAATLSHLASFGYVVASVEYDYNPLDTDHHAPVDSMTAAIELLTQSPPAAIGAISDGTRIVAAGHGLGAKAAVWMALENGSIDAVVALDALDDEAGIIPSSKRPSITPEMMAAMDVPALYLVTERGPAGLSECVPRPSNGCRFREATPAGVPKYLMVLEDFGHLQLVDGYNCLSCLTCDRGPQATHDAKQLAARGLAVAFLEYTLRGKAGYLPYLAGVELEARRAQNLVLDATAEWQFCVEQ